ncbi:MAG: hypothetical protein ACLTDM_01735 [Clostridium butyricum]
MKNTLINLLKEKGYTVTEYANTITFFNNIYSVNLCSTSTIYTISINLVQSDISSSKLLISYSSITFTIKSIRNWLHTIISFQITDSYNSLTPLTLINDTILKTACSDLLNLLDEYLISLALNPL